MQSQAWSLASPAAGLHSWWSAVSPGYPLGSSLPPGPSTPGPFLVLPRGGHPGAVSGVCTSELRVPKVLWTDEGPGRSLQVLRSSPRLSCLAGPPSLVFLAHSSPLLSSGLSSSLTLHLPLLPLPQLPAAGLASCGQGEVMGTPETNRGSGKCELLTLDWFFFFI